MKHTFVKITTLIAVTISSAASLVMQPTLAAPPPGSGGATVPGSRPGAICSGPDLVAKEIKFQVIRRTSKFAGRVRITGIVRNIGNKPYISNPNQQGVSLYEVDGTRRSVGDKTFQNLRPGQEVKVVFERDWSASNEFPPKYAMEITFDPDIRNDGNLNNDDCNLSNNTLERDGAAINALFPR
jgi:hypothetical protein